MSKLSRRSLIKNLTVTTGALTFSSLLSWKFWKDNKALAQSYGNDIQINRWSYKGRSVEIRRNPRLLQQNQMNVFIDNKAVCLHFDQNKKVWVSGYLPWDEFKSPEQAVRTMIDLGLPNSI